MINETIANTVTSISNANLKPTTTVEAPATNITQNTGFYLSQEAFLIDFLIQQGLTLKS